MIIANGTLQTIEKTGGGLLDGRPVEVVETIGNPIECNIKTITHDHKGVVVDGVFTQSSYEVLIDTVAIPDFTYESVILTDNRGKRLGKFRVQDIQHLDCVDAVKITV